jgi:hypothetical protein
MHSMRSAYHGPATALNRPGTWTMAPELNGGEGASPSGRGQLWALVKLWDPRTRREEG